MTHTARSFEDLVIWQRAHTLVLAVLRSTNGFPREIRFELTSQLRRAAVSVASNIAEGHSRRGDRAFASFVDVAVGSAGELEYLLLLARDLGCLDKERHAALSLSTRELRRMLSAFRRKLEQ